MEDAILSPRAHMAEAGGPRKVMLDLWRRFGSLGFSEAWPQPAHTACTHTHTHALIKHSGCTEKSIPNAHSLKFDARNDE